jgi:hypothetical protein
MLSKSISYAFMLLVAISCGAANAQTIDQERAALAQYNAQLATLRQASARIDTQLQQLASSIAREEQESAPQRKARDTAQQQYLRAEALATRVPSNQNLENAEATRFTRVLAERKYERAAQTMLELTQQRTAAQQQLEENRQKIDRVGRQISQQHAAIAALEQELLALAQAQVQRELRSSQDALSKTREEHATALAEIAALKARLARKPAPANLPAKAITVATLAVPPHAIASDTDGGTTLSRQAVAQEKSAIEATQQEILMHKTATTNSAPDTGINAGISDNIDNNTGLPSLLGDKRQYLALVDTAQQGARARTSKILTMNTYSDNRITRKTSHSLKHLGNGVYSGSTLVRSGMTTFVVGSKQWRWEIAEADNNQSFTFVLDTRDNSNTELKLFPAAAVQ